MYNLERCVVNDALLKLIRDGLSEYSVDTVGSITSSETFGFKITAEEVIVGAAVVKVRLGEVYVEYLFVNSNFRGRGLGTMLMNSIMEFALSIKASFITLTTFSFQAPDFYKKMGFDLEFIRRGYDRGVSKYYFRKNLTQVIL